jgi:hypothetical protein
VTQAQIRIGRKQVGPAHRNGAKRSLRELKGDSIFSPKLLGYYKTEGLSSQRMKRMDDSDLLRNACTRCI